MKTIISIGLAFIIATLFSVSFINEMLFEFQVMKLNDYHYAMVNEVESSDFSPSVIQAALDNKSYDVKIENKSMKDDLRIYQITTSKIVKMPIFGIQKEYIKESIAR